MSSGAEADWEPAEQAARWVREGRLRDAIVALPRLRGAAAIVEDAAIEGDRNVLAQAVDLLGDADPEVAGRAAYILGERAVRRGTAAEVERPLAAALRRALASETSRILATAAALRECARVDGVGDAVADLVEVVRRAALGHLGTLELMWAAEALFDLGWSAERIVAEAGPADPAVSRALQANVEDIEHGLRAVAGRRRDAGPGPTPRGS